MNRTDKLKQHATATLTRANCAAFLYALTVTHDDAGSAVRCENAAGVTWWLHYSWRDGEPALHEWEVFGLVPVVGKEAD